MRAAAVPLLSACQQKFRIACNKHELTIHIEMFKGFRFRASEPLISLFGYEYLADAGPTRFASEMEEPPRIDNDPHNAVHRPKTLWM